MCQVVGSRHGMNANFMFVVVVGVDDNEYLRRLNGEWKGV